MLSIYIAIFISMERMKSFKSGWCLHVGHNTSRIITAIWLMTQIHTNIICTSGAILCDCGWVVCMSPESWENIKNKWVNDNKHFVMNKIEWTNKCARVLRCVTYYIRVNGNKTFKTLK
jgi:hypothetical protein